MGEQDVVMGIRLQLEFEGRSPTSRGQPKMETGPVGETPEMNQGSPGPQEPQMPAPSTTKHPMVGVKSVRSPGVSLGKSQGLTTPDFQAPQVPHNTVVHVKYQAPPSAGGTDRRLPCRCKAFANGCQGCLRFVGSGLDVDV